MMFKHKPSQAQMNKDALKIVLKGLEHYMPYAEQHEVVILAELITYFKEVIKADD